MAVYESKGPMSVVNNQYCQDGDQGAAWQVGDIILKYSGSQPKGHLKITNNTTAASKTQGVSQLASGALVWDASVDDPSQTPGDSFTIEFSGKAEDLKILFVKFDGAGHGEAQDAPFPCAAP